MNHDPETGCALMALAGAGIIGFIAGFIAKAIIG